MTIKITNVMIEQLVVEAATRLHELRETQDLPAVDLFVIARTAVDSTLRAFADVGLLVLVGDTAAALAKAQVDAMLDPHLGKSFLDGFREAHDPGE